MTQTYACALPIGDFDLIATRDLTNADVSLALDLGYSARWRTLKNGERWVALALVSYRGLVWRTADGRLATRPTWFCVV